MKSKVLILSSTNDIHALQVQHHLQEMNAEVDICRMDDVISDCSFTYSLGLENNSCLLERAAGNIDFHSYTSIWRRRPGNFRAGNFVESWIGKMVETEIQSVQDSLLRSLDCLWVNYPPNDRAAIYKLWQLDVATCVGLEIPKTLVTNKPQAVRDFFEQCKGKVIYKLASEQSNFLLPPEERAGGVPTLPLREADLPFLDQVVHSPHVFQEYLEKASDIRVTIVGKRMFAVQIDSQSGKGKLDWRNDYSVPMVPVELPQSINDKCFELTKRLGLNYGAIDLVLTKDGEYVFLEINCAGQFLWAEFATELQISLAVAELLAGRAEPLVESGPALIRSGHYQ